MRMRSGFWMAGLVLAGCLHAQTLVDSDLTYDTVVSSGLSFPIAMAFLDPSDPNRFFVIEKNSGRVKLEEVSALVNQLFEMRKLMKHMTKMQQRMQKRKWSPFGKRR